MIFSHRQSVKNLRPAMPVEAPQTPQIWTDTLK